MLSRIRARLDKLVAHMKNKYGEEDKKVIRMISRYGGIEMSESSNKDGYETYTRDKGEEMVFCLRHKAKGDIHDINTLMFVAIHELAHVYSSSYHHTKEFWANFKFLLREATHINIYNAVNYASQPVEYCNMTITDNVLYNTTLRKTIKNGKTVYV